MCFLLQLEPAIQSDESTEYWSFSVFICSLKIRKQVGIKINMMRVIKKTKTHSRNIYYLAEFPEMQIIIIINVRNSWCAQLFNPFGVATCTHTRTLSWFGLHALLSSFMFITLNWFSWHYPKFMCGLWKLGRRYINSYDHYFIISKGHTCHTLSILTNSVLQNKNHCSINDLFCSYQWQNKSFVIRCPVLYFDVYLRGIYSHHSQIFDFSLKTTWKMSVSKWTRNVFLGNRFSSVRLIPWLTSGCMPWEKKLYAASDRTVRLAG